MTAPLPLNVAHIFTMEITVDAPQSVGRTADGMELRIVPLTGGTVSGPRLQGTVLAAAGADWLRVEADGTAHIDVRLTIRSASGGLLYVQYGGIRTGPAAVLARLAAGEVVPPTDYHFRTLIRFQTAAPDLAWLNRTLAVGVGQRSPSGPRYDVYAVL